MRNLVFFLFISTGLACEFKYSRPILNLSGPLTITLDHLGLLQSPHLKAIPAHVSYTKKQFPGARIKGGIFVASKTLYGYNNPIIFYDENSEQRRFFKSTQLTSIEIETRGDPFEVVQKQLKILRPWLKGCQSIVNKLLKKINLVASELSTSKSVNRPLVFFLGKISPSKLPPMLVLNDGAVGKLIELKKIKSYPSSYAYLPWSQKILSNMNSPLLIGLNGEKSAAKSFKIASLDRHRFNITHPHLLIPGLSQVNFLYAWTKKLRFELKL